jgi:hypothetical protein
LTWGWTLLAGYILAALLSWFPITPGVTRTIVRVVVLSWVSGASVLWALALNRAPATPQLLKTVQRFVIVIAACNIIATPMLTRDVWCYAAFARLTASGVDPYLVELPESLRAEFKTNSCGGTPTYGPAWVYGAAAIDRFVMPLGPTVEVLALRLVMVVAWMGMIWGGMQLLKLRDLRTRIVGLVALSVVPISIFELVAEAHNDVVMMALVVYWLVLRSKGSWLGPIPLVLSVLVKYVTAPLLVLAAIDAWRRGRRGEMATALVLIASLAATAALLWQDGALLSSLTKNNANWRWLSAPFAIEMIVKNVAPFTWVAPAVWSWRALLGLGVLWYVREWFRSPPTDVSLYRAVAAATLGLLLSADYLWPWYLVWALPFVILAEDRLLSAIAWPFFVILPVAHLAWAGGRRELGHRPEIIVFLLAIVAAAWFAQAWVALRSQPTELANSSV